MKAHNFSKEEKSACKLCQSEWGNYWEKIEGISHFFCCEICAMQYKHLVDVIIAETGWDTIETIDMTGTSRGRSGTAKFKGSEIKFFVSFGSEGNIWKFQVI